MQDTKFPVKKPNEAPQNPYLPSGPVEPLMFEEFAGMNTATTRPRVNDKQMFWCDGFIPLGPRRYLRTLYGVGPAIFAVSGPPPPPASHTFVIAGLVIGSGFGKIATSPTGVTWTDQASGYDGAGQPQGAGFGNNLYVVDGAIGFAGAILTSPDGVTWTPRTNSFGVAAGFGDSATYGVGIYVVGGSDDDGVGHIETSPDGVTWTAQDCTNVFGKLSPYKGGVVRGLTFGGSTFVAVGFTDDGGAAGFSTDGGVTWTNAATNFVGDGVVQLSAVTFGNGLFVAVGDTSSGTVIYTSSDGNSWTLQAGNPIASSGNLASVTFGNGVYIAGGRATNGVILKSSDGVTWAAKTNGFGFGAIVLCLGFNGANFVAGGVLSGPVGEIEYSTDDGESWITATFSGFSELDAIA